MAAMKTWRSKFSYASWSYHFPNLITFFVALVSPCFVSLVSPMRVQNHVTFICNSELEKIAKSQKILCFFNYATLTIFFI